jgi:signal transduction histidine kinase/phage shock protein PspC (stress-responsive transcriptional regulator)
MQTRTRAFGPVPVPGGEYPFRRAYRDPNGRLLAGVAAGLAKHLRLPAVAVRLVFVALLLANGLGALLYIVFWAVLPPTPAEVVAPEPPAAARSERRSRMLQVLGLCVAAAGVFLLEVQYGWFGLDATLVALVTLVAFGAGIIWHQADPTGRRRHATDRPEAPRRAEEGEPSRAWFLVRVIAGGVLIIVGIVGILGVFAPFGHANLNQTGTALLFAVLAFAGVFVALAPLLLRIFGQLRQERVARIREQERAEVAAVVHDQVLHTLALIQRNASDSTSVLRLARGQERSLRGWLYKPAGSPAEYFSAALEEVAAEVEDTYAVAVETVVVGDAPNDEHAAAVVSAAREALVNAARHAKVSSVSLYAEVEDDEISVYVRDRGSGFDVSTVSSDRHGVSGSIVGRMQRHGGHAEIRTAPGEGTEVALTMPRGKGDRS